MISNLSVTAAGAYSVVVTYAGGLCVDSLSGSAVTVDPLNIASFTQSADTVDLLTSGDVIFTSTGSGSNYDWDFGDSGTSTTQDPTHTYTAVGTYTVTFTVSGGACPDAVGTGTVVVINTTSMDDLANNGVSLLQNRPNPFRDNTTFEFNLAQGAAVSLKVYNVLGEEVANIFEGNAAAGMNTFDWNGTNNDGDKLSQGTYIYTLSVNGTPLSNSLVILK